LKGFFSGGEAPLKILRLERNGGGVFLSRGRPPWEPPFLSIVITYSNLLVLLRQSVLLLSPVKSRAGGATNVTKSCAFNKVVIYLSIVSFRIMITLISSVQSFGSYSSFAAQSLNIFHLQKEMSSFTAYPQPRIPVSSFISLTA
jgi:hypothetical protein